jgi:hypothetical protein
VHETHTIRTDDKGSFNEVTRFNSPAFFAITVHNVYFTITSPSNITVDGSVDLFAQGKHTVAKVNASTVQKISLGSCHIAHTDNTLTITGKTIPPKPNVDLVLEVDHA